MAPPQLLTETARGVYVIAATPFGDDGALDLPSIDRLMDFYLGHRVHGVTILGMMGEAHKLSADEARLVVQRVLARVSGQIPVVVGVSAPGIASLRALALEAMLMGAAGVMAAPPPGIKGDDALYAYFAMVFEALGPNVPLALQDYPQTTGVYLAPKVFNRLVADFPQLVMLKHEDCPGLAKLSQIRAMPGRRVSILVGNGGLYLPQELARGADGAMTGFAYPEMLVEVYQRFAAGRGDEAEDLFDLYLPLVRHEQQPNIGLAIRKEILHRRGAIASPRQRSPGSALNADDRRELDQLVRRLERRLEMAA